MLLLFMFILYHFKVDVIYMVSARENTTLFSFVIKSFNLPLINMDLFFFLPANLPQSINDIHFSI